MTFKRALIFAPSFEQRISKMVYSLLGYGLKTTVYAETSEVSKEFENYTSGVEYAEIPVHGRIKRTPLGSKRKEFIRRAVGEAIAKDGMTLIIARDVNYGSIVGSILKDFDRQRYCYIVDIADNYDLLYDSYSNAVKRTLFRLGFRFLTSRALHYADAIFIVAGINRNRLLREYPKELTNTMILLLRNLPLTIDYLDNTEKIPNSMVYVGKIDEISRDPFYVLESLSKMPQYSLHFYSNQSVATLERIKEYVKVHAMQDRVIFHERVNYDELAEAISVYEIGLVPHKRRLITDYTTPNKIYDYKRSGIVTVMSDCPSLVEENDEFQFGLVYSKEMDNFIRVVRQARNFELSYDIHIPVWQEEFMECFGTLTLL